MKEIIEKIKSQGYWRIVIRPTKSYFRSNRFNTNDLGKVLKDSQIHLRGWSYPFNVEGNGDYKTIAQNAIGNEVSYDGMIEAWRFYTSGQFEQYISIREDWNIDNEKLKKIQSQFIFQKELGAKAAKLLEIVNTNYRFTEIFLFASNLFQNKNFEDVAEFQIIIELHGVKDRMLFMWDSFRQVWSPYICAFDTDQIVYDDIYKKNDLIAKSSELALSKTVETFRLFGWKDPNRQALEEDQKKLLERRF